MFCLLPFNPVFFYNIVTSSKLACVCVKKNQFTRSLLLCGPQMNQPCSDLYGYTFETAWYKEKYTNSGTSTACIAASCRCKYIMSLALLSCINVTIMCCLHFSFLLGCVCNIHHCCFCISVHCKTRQKEKDMKKKRKEKKNTQKMTHSKQRFGHMDIAVLCCCRR